MVLALYLHHVKYESNRIARMTNTVLVRVYGTHTIETTTSFLTVHHIMSFILMLLIIWSMVLYYTLIHVFMDSALICKAVVIF